MRLAFDSLDDHCFLAATVPVSTVSDPLARDASHIIVGQSSSIDPLFLALEQSRWVIVSYYMGAQLFHYFRICIV